MRRSCSIPGCDKDHRAKGYCRNHWYSWRRYGDPLASRPSGEVQAFLDGVFAYEGSDCLAWPFSRTQEGYGQVRFGNRLHTVSRLVCERRNGPPPSPAHQAAHSCGKGHEGCVTKRHLSWKTPLENCADRVEHGTSPRGERQGNSKLKKADLQEILTLKGKLTLREIGERFGVGQQNICDIYAGRRWGWFTGITPQSKQSSDAWEN